MTEHLVDLGKHRNGRHVLSGTEKGKETRNAEGLLALDPETQVTVHVPEDVFSVNMSFFLGMFEILIYRLGDEGFRKMYTFTGTDISRTIDAAIREARPPGGAKGFTGSACTQFMGEEDL